MHASALEITGCTEAVDLTSARLGCALAGFVPSSVHTPDCEQVREALEDATKAEKALPATILNEGDAVRHTLQALTTVATHLEALQVCTDRKSYPRCMLRIIDLVELVACMFASAWGSHCRRYVGL